MYQFWQREEKDRVNKSEVKIGADELAPVTQLFTEDYMVLFLLENTLGAWWTARRGKPELSGYTWTYLRLNEDGTPAAGTFDDWPTRAKELRVLDPCMGSGHFLTFALPILARMRVAEEGLSLSDAIFAVLRDNLFGLELDPRCSQIAAFNLALTAWRLARMHFELPQLNLACSGLGINAKEEDWVKLAGKDERLRGAMKALYGLFQQAPVLGSLIDPRRVGGNLFVAEFEKVQPLLESALGSEVGDETVRELAVTAKGLVRASEILSAQFTLIATNVPYLGRGNQEEVLAKYCGDKYADAKADLATCFVDRSVRFCADGGSVALVTPQSWLFQSSYKSFRRRLIETIEWDMVAKLGVRAFETITGEVVNVALLVLTRSTPSCDQMICALNVEDRRSANDKSVGLRESPLSSSSQEGQLTNPDARFVIGPASSGSLLSHYADTYKGICTGDSDRFQRYFWEIESVALQNSWAFQQSSIDITGQFGGREGILLWENENGKLRDYVVERLGKGRTSAWIRGREAWGHQGVVIRIMKHLPVTRYTGELYDNNVAVIIPQNPEHLEAVWSFCQSSEFNSQVRRVNQKLSVTDEAFVKVPFDLAHWQGGRSPEISGRIAPPCFGRRDTMAFSGHPKGSDQALQVGVARLLGYRWPRQTGS